MRRPLPAPVKKIFAVGSTSIDEVANHPDLDRLDNAKHRPKNFYTHTGGGGANFVIALRALQKIFDDHVQTTLCTKIGRAEETVSRLFEHLARKELQGINLLDAFEGKTYSLPVGRITTYRGGRFISSIYSPHSPSSLARGIKERIKSAVEKSDLVFVNTRDLELSQIAVQAAHEAGIPVLLDYTVYQGEETSRHEELLSHAKWVVAPAESLVLGMQSANAETLLGRLSSDYGLSFAAVSNDGEPVLVYNETKQLEISVPESRVTDPSGAGDVRNAALALFLLRGNDFITSLEKATHIATIGVEYYGREWTIHLKSRLQQDALFNNMPMEPA